MVICTRCGRQAVEGETFCPQCDAFLEWTGAPTAPQEAPPHVLPTASAHRRVGTIEVAGSPVVAALSNTCVTVEPAAQASITIDVVNRGRTVDRLSLEIRGPAAAWSSVEPPRLNLMPGSSAAATVVFRPPRSSAVRAGRYQADIVVLSAEHPDAPVMDCVDVDVAPFLALEATLAPSVLRGSAATSARLRASNAGNVAIDLAFAASDPETAFEFWIEPPTVRVDAGATFDAMVMVKPREPIESGPDRTRPFRVLVTATDGAQRTLEGAQRALDGTFVQAPVPKAAAAPLLATVSASAVRVEPGGQAASRWRSSTGPRPSTRSRWRCAARRRHGRPWIPRA